MRCAPLLLALASAACLELPEPDEFGEHVVVAADPGLELCGGSLAHMDGFIARLSAEFGVDPPAGDDRFTYYWLERERFYERSRCPESATACARSGLSFNPLLPANHELVHNVAGPFGNPRPVFNEGIAVAYEGLGDAYGTQSPPRGDLHELLALTTSEELIAARSGYATAGAFTTYLVRAHGIDAYLRMHAAVGPREPMTGIDAIFREEFGVSLDDSIAAFEATADDCGRLERDAKLLECDAPELERDDDRFALHRSVACEQDDVVGPYFGASVVVFRTVTIPAAGDYVVQVVGDDPRNRVGLQPCTICDGAGLDFPAGAPPRTVALAAGRHSLRLHGPADVRTSLGLRIEPAASAFAP